MHHKDQIQAQISLKDSLLEKHHGVPRKTDTKNPNVAYLTS